METQPSIAANDPAIRVTGLRKSYGHGDDELIAVDDISFEIERGNVVGLLGPNGAGKTTTIKSMLGLIIPDVGTVEIAGIDVHSDPDRAYNRVGAMLEGARNVYWRLTPRENLAFFAGLGGQQPSTVRGRHAELLEQFGLTDHADDAVNDLSRGMKQKVSLASTLARDVDVVFMDEPTLGLDIETSLELRSELRRLAERESVTIVLSSHDMDVIEAVCDSVIVMQDGSIVAQDEVSALLDVFQTRIYRITLEGSISDRTGLLPTDIDADIVHEDGISVIEFTARDEDDIYAILDALRERHVNIRSIDSQEPDLEDVFLELTGAAGDARTDATQTAAPGLTDEGRSMETVTSTGGEP